VRASRPIWSGAVKKEVTWALIRTMVNQGRFEGNGVWMRYWDAEVLGFVSAVHSRLQNPKTPCLFHTKEWNPCSLCSSSVTFSRLASL
jgi:hypothetical protein